MVLAWQDGYVSELIVLIDSTIAYSLPAFTISDRSGTYARVRVWAVYNTYAFICELGITKDSGRESFICLPLERADASE